MKVFSVPAKGYSLFQSQTGDYGPAGFAFGVQVPVCFSALSRSGDVKGQAAAVNPPALLRSLFPEIMPFRTLMLPVSKKHTLYVEQVGNPGGYPVLFLHGGPGAGISPNHRRFFDPSYYCVTLFDQRQSGKSTPALMHNNFEDNTTAHSIEDIEKIREHLGIQKWMVFGGSWGSTLALAYAQAYPERVTGLVLRGICLGLPEENHWAYQDGASRIYPEAWQKFQAPVPPEKRQRMLEAYYDLLTDPDAAVRARAAKAWNRWATVLSDPVLSSILDTDIEESPITNKPALEAFYFKNHCFLTGDKALLRKENLMKIRHIPTWIVHGERDAICPPSSAELLSRALPHAQYTLIPGVGHTAFAPKMIDALVRATEAFKQILHKA